MIHERSRRAYQRAVKSLAGGVSSQFRARKPYPLFFERAEGSRVIDVDGNTYVDFTLSQGPILLGHRHRGVEQAIIDVLGRGILYAGQHDLEYLLAEWACAHIPSAELVRFGSCGSEMVEAALRTARYVTGRPKILKFEGHYHGWFDNVAISVNPGPGEAGPRERPHAVPWTGGQSGRALADAVIAPFNDLEAVKRLLDEHEGEVAAVILEPIMCNNGCIPADPEFLSGLRSECTRRGILLIFDEIITGFRMGLGGAQAYYGITPDLSVFGKGMGSGLPIAMLVGKEPFMRPIAEGKAIHAGTYNSNTVCMAASLATVRAVEELGVDRLFEAGNRLREGLATLARNAGVPLVAQGPGPMFHTAFTTVSPIREYRDLWSIDRAAQERFIELLLHEGVRVIGRGLWYLSFAHSDEDIARALSTAEKAFALIAAEQSGRAAKGG